MSVQPSGNPEKMAKASMPPVAEPAPKEATGDVSDVPAPSPPNAPVAVKPAASASPREIYGSFWLDKTEFALHANVVLEVVDEPELIAPMPLAPPYMRGLFNLRGTIIPIIDLRTLLEFPETDTGDRKIAIIEDGEVCIGLMVDKTGEVLNATGAARVDFRPREGAIKDVVVEGLLKLEKGKRIIQILDPCEILNLEKVPRGETFARSRARGFQVSSGRGERFNCISFQFGHTTCAIDLRYVQEVMEGPEIDDSLLTHDCFIGITDLREQIIPVADFRKFMGDFAELKKSKEVPPIRKMLVLQTDGGLIGLLIYSIDSIMTCFETDILQFTKLALPRADIVRGCLISKTNELVMLLDHDVLRSDPILADTAKRCQEVHPPAEKAKNPEFEKNSGNRLTFIVFKLVTRFALESSVVSEVIDYPDTLLTPPYALEFVDGIINLRGELITLINPRILYGLESTDRKDKKVMIFWHDKRKYGIVVDSVDEIVNTLSSRVAAKMTIDHGDLSKQVAEDDGGCIQSGAHGAVMILDTAAFLRRCFKWASNKSIDPEKAL